jgi:hypothetical protein
VAAAVDAVAMQQRTTNNDAVDQRHLAAEVIDIIHCGASTGEPCFNAGRLMTQHLSDGSYYAISNLMLRKGRRHAVRGRRGRGRRAQIRCNDQIEDDVDGGTSLAL